MSEAPAIRGSGPATVDVATDALRRRAVGVLWASKQFDTVEIAALLGLEEAQVVGARTATAPTTRNDFWPELSR